MTLLTTEPEPEPEEEKGRIENTPPQKLRGGGGDGDGDGDPVDKDRLPSPAMTEPEPEESLHLDLSHQSLTTWPGDEVTSTEPVGRVTPSPCPAQQQQQQLTSLDLSHNLLTSLTAQPLLESLTVLKLSHNRLTSLPWPCLRGLPNLQHLDVSFNCLERLPEADDATRLPAALHLRHLDASHNQLRTLPAWLVNLPRMRRLQLGHNPDLDLDASLPDDSAFGRNCRQLRLLDLTCCRLTSLPAALAQVLDLQCLVLGSDDDAATTTTCPDNQLYTLPPPVLRLAGLTRLAAPNVRLSELPESLGHALPRLRELDLRSNSLYWLPASFVLLSRLEKAELSHNQLESLPEGVERMPRLRELLLADNQLTWITEDIGGLDGSLRTLDLYRNKLDVEGARPLRELANLHALDLAGNDLSSAEIRCDVGLRDYERLERRLREQFGCCARVKVREEIYREPEEEDGRWCREKEESDDDDASDDGSHKWSINSEQSDEDWDEEEVKSSPVRKASSSSSSSSSADDFDPTEPCQYKPAPKYDFDDMGRYYSSSADRFAFCPSDLHNRSLRSQKKVGGNDSVKWELHVVLRPGKTTRTKSYQSPESVPGQFEDAVGNETVLEE